MVRNTVPNVILRFSKCVESYLSHYKFNPRRGQEAIIRRSPLFACHHSARHFILSPNDRKGIFPLELFWGEGAKQS